MGRPLGLPIERVRPGMLVAIHSCIEDSDGPETEWTPFGPRTVRSTSTYTGTPLRVLSVSPPFVCVTDGKEREAIDLRRIGIIKLRKSYVKAFCGPKGYDRLVSDGKPGTPECKNEPKKELPPACPNCKSKFVIGMIERCPEGHRHKMVLCTKCGWWEDLGHD